jgi:hypothetical protein
MGTDVRIRHMGGMIPKEENCPSATSSTTNPTWTVLVMNPSLCGVRPVAICDMTLQSLNRYFCVYNV